MKSFTIKSSELDANLSLAPKDYLNFRQMENKTITWDEWEETYKPLKDKNDERKEISFRDVSAIQAGIKANTLWTMLDADGVTCFVSGVALVNRMGYFICEVPYTEGAQITVIDQEDIDAEAFEGKVTELIEKMYGLNLNDVDLTDDILQDIRYDGHDPYQYVLEIGEKHDLTRIDK